MRSTTGATSAELTWRGPFTNAEVNALHAEAFETRLVVPARIERELSE